MREKIIAGNIYHVLNRGVDKRKIFLNDQDYFRFIHDLFEFNDVNPINNNFYKFNNNNVSARRYIEKSQPRKLLVDILAFCLMPNHYHLLVKPRSDNGLFKFIKRLNMGYSRYFNDKNKRRGALFEGRYKSIAIKDESHLIHLPYYIHLNPLDINFLKWRDREIKDYKKAINFLENYRWSSHLDYIGQKNFPSITSREFLLEFFGGTEGYKKSINNWLKDIEVDKIKGFILED